MTEAKVRKGVRVHWIGHPEHTGTVFQKRGEQTWVDWDDGDYGYVHTSVLVPESHDLEPTNG